MLEDFHPNNEAREDSGQTSTVKPNRKDCIDLSQASVYLYGKGFTQLEVATYFRVTNSLNQEKISIDHSAQGQKEVLRSYNKLNLFKPVDVEEVYRDIYRAKSSTFEKISSMLPRENAVRVSLKGSDTQLGFRDKEIHRLAELALQSLNGFGVDPSTLAKSQEAVVASVSKAVGQDPEDYIKNVDHVLESDLEQSIPAVLIDAASVFSTPSVVKHDVSDPEINFFSNVSNKKQISKVHSVSQFLGETIPNVCVYDVGDYSNTHLFDCVESSQAPYLPNVLLFCEEGSVGDAYTNVNMWKKIGHFADDPSLDPTDLPDYDLLKSKINLPCAKSVADSKPFVHEKRAYIPASLYKMSSPDDLMDKRCISLVSLDIVKSFANTKSKHGAELFQSYVFFLLDPYSQLCIAVPRTLLNQLFGLQLSRELFNNGKNYSWHGYLILRSSNVALYFEACVHAVVATYPYFRHLLLSVNNGFSYAPAYHKALGMLSAKIKRVSSERIFEFLYRKFNPDTFNIYVGKTSVKDHSFNVWLKTQSIDLVLGEQILDVDVEEQLPDFNDIFSSLRQQYRHDEPGEVKTPPEGSSAFSDTGGIDTDDHPFEKPLGGDSRTTDPDDTGSVADTGTIYNGSGGFPGIR